MAHLDEYFYTNIYHGISREDKKTIRENIRMYNDNKEMLETAGLTASFAGIFMPTIGKVGSFVSGRIFEDLRETGDERLRDKVRIIAKDAETAELIKELYEKEDKQTPHIIILSELIKRQQEEITELSRRYDKSSIEGKYKRIIEEKKEEREDDISKSMTEMSEWINSEEERRYEGIEEKYRMFENLSKIGSAVGCDELNKVANTAISGITIFKSIREIGSILSSGGGIGIINPITSIICAGAGLISMFGRKRRGGSNNMGKYMEIIIKELNKINRQMGSIQREIRENFDIVFKYLERVVERIERQYIMIRNIHNKIERIEKKINEIQIICEYYGRQNLLQDLYRTVHRIIHGSQEYFETMGKLEFNNLFLDLFYWLENHSFDYATNGYIYALTGGCASDKFTTPIHNRLGFLASLIKFPHATKMVNPVIFSICTDAIEVLIHKGLKYYGTLPMTYDRIIPIMNKANLTEQFIDYSREPQILSNIINHNYIPLVEQLKLSLTEWVNITSRKYGITNFIHITILNTLEEIISATPIITTQVQATALTPGLSAVISQLPINLSSIGGIFSPIWKICELAVKLGIGNYDFKFNLSHGEPFGEWHLRIPVDIWIQIDFILNGTRYNVYNESWHCPNVIKGLGDLTEKSILGHWTHNYSSTRWTLKDYTKSNSYFENIIKKACEEKLYSIRQEIRDISYPIAVQINTLCDKLQEQYIIINKLFELNNTSLDKIQSGIWIKTRLHQLINFENTYGYNIISFCDFSRTLALQVGIINNESSIKTEIRNSINKLNELSSDIIYYEEEYKYMEEKERIEKEERIIMIEEEREMIRRKEEMEKINKMGMMIGRILTIHNIIKYLEQTGKTEEMEILRSKYNINIEENEELRIMRERGETDIIFNTSFCNGSSLMLLEITIELQRYPRTMIEIQKLGHRILSKIMMTTTKTISGIIRGYLEM